MNFRFLSLALASAAILVAQQPSTPPTTAVLINLAVKPNVERAQVMKVMPDEIRDTVKLYLTGKIQQWYSRSDGRGVVFILNCSGVEEAKAVMESLPLAKSGLVNLDYTAMGPLRPLGLLLTDAAPKTTPQ